MPVKSILCCFQKFSGFLCIPWGILWGVLWEHGVFGLLLQGIRSLYTCRDSLAHISGNKWDSFPFGPGLLHS